MKYKIALMRKLHAEIQASELVKEHVAFSFSQDAAGWYVFQSDDEGMVRQMAITAAITNEDFIRIY
jgi:hypothetical protein